MLLSGLKSELDELHEILRGLTGERINKQMYKTEKRGSISELNPLLFLVT